MKIEKIDLRDGGCSFCKRAEYDFSSGDVKVSYPYEHVYKLEMGNYIHRLCEDCLITLNAETNNALK